MRRLHPSLFTKGKLLLLGFLMMLVLGFASIPPASAANPVVTDCTATGASGSMSCTINITTGDLIVVAFGSRWASGGLGNTVTSISDGKGSTFTQTVQATASCSVCAAASNQIDSEIWFAPASGTCSPCTVTINFQGTSATTNGAVVYDVTNTQTGTPVSGTGTCDTNPAACGKNPQLSAAISFATPSVAISGSVCIGCGAGGAGTGFTFVDSTAVETSEYSVCLSGSGCTSPTAMQFSNAITAATYANVGIVTNSAAQTVTVTTTVTATQTVNCSGACDHTPTGSTYLGSKVLDFGEAQNNIAISSAMATNVSAKVKAVNINTATSTLYIWLYATFQPGIAPSQANPFFVIFEDNETITNGTTNVSFSKNPSATGFGFVCGGCWVAIGLYTAASKSNSGTVTGSGVQFYQATVSTGVTWFGATYSVATPPKSFFFGTGPLATTFYAFYKLQYTVNIVTTTSTVTGTVSTTISTTTTFTSTSVTRTTQTTTVSTMDSNLAIQNSVSMSVIMIVILAPAFLFAGVLGILARSPQGAGIGFGAGLMLGSAIGYQASLVPPIFTGIAVFVGAFVLIGMWRIGGNA